MGLEPPELPTMTMAWGIKPIIIRCPQKANKNFGKPAGNRACSPPLMPPLDSAFYNESRSYFGDATMPRFWQHFVSNGPSPPLGPMPEPSRAELDALDAYS